MGYNIVICDTCPLHSALILIQAKDDASSGEVQTIIQGGQYLADRFRWSFEAVKGGVPSRSEGLFTSLTTKSLDFFSFAVATIAHHRVLVLISYTEIKTLWIEAGITLGRDNFGMASFTFGEIPLNSSGFQIFMRQYF